MVILGCASAFTRILTIEQVPVQVSEMMIHLTDNPILLLLLINTLLLLVGMVMDTTPAILVLAPILFPVATSFGIEPVHFGLIMVVNLAIGFITPPLGINLFVAARVGDSPIGVVIRGLIPFLVAMIACLLIITYVPDVTMFLVDRFGL